MNRSTSSRLTATAACAALLASMSVAMLAATAAARDCTYTFPDEGGTYPGDTVVAGDVICGGPGDDVVSQMDGGRFFGGRGDDSVGTQNGGRFFGNVGADAVKSLAGGTFYGGFGKDQVSQVGGGRAPAVVLEEATFRGGPGADAAETVGEDGTFYGGSASDSVQYLYGEFRGGPDADDVFQMNSGGRFFGARGNDAVDRDGGTYDGGAMFGTSHFNGGRGTDFADVCGAESTRVSVETTSDDCP